MSQESISANLQSQKFETSKFSNENTSDIITKGAIEIDSPLSESALYDSNQATKNDDLLVTYNMTNKQMITVANLPTDTDSEAHSSSEAKQENNLTTATQTEKNQLSKIIETQTKSSEIANRPRGWMQLFKSLANFLKRLTPWLWATVIILVIIPHIGQFFTAKAFQAKLPNQNDISIIATDPASNAINESKIFGWDDVEKALISTLHDTRQTSEGYASQKLDAWVNELMAQVDNSFLDWYFGYFNQKKIEYKSFFTGISANMEHWLNPNSLTPQEKIAEAITEDFQTEFARRVLRPQISQLQLERIAAQTVKYHLDRVGSTLKFVPTEQQIPKADWERYLNNISISIKDTEGKIFSVSTNKLVTGGAYIALKPLISPLLPTIGSKVAVTLLSKTGAKIATKTGVIVASKVSGALLDCTVGVGILVWDIWDTYHTASIEKPILRNSLAKYIQEVKESLLSNSENGIMTPVDEINRSILDGLRVARFMTTSNLKD